MHLASSGRKPPAQANLRGHLLKGTIRVLVLLTADVGVVLLGQWGLRSLRDGALGPRTGAISQSAFPEAAIFGPELAVALIAGMLVVGGYRAGDVWKEPARLLAAVAVAVSLMLYMDIWGGSPLLLAERGLALWASVGMLSVQRVW